jgi:hypothetical protein
MLLGSLLSQTKKGYNEIAASTITLMCPQIEELVSISHLLQISIESEQSSFISNVTVVTLLHALL